MDQGWKGRARLPLLYPRELEGREPERRKGGNRTPSEAGGGRSAASGSPRVSLACSEVWGQHPSPAIALRVNF